MERNHLNKPRKDWKKELEKLEQYCSEEFYVRVLDLIESKDERFNKCIVALYQLIDIIESDNDCEHNVNTVKSSQWVFNEIELLRSEVENGVKGIGKDIRTYKDSVHNDIGYCLFLIKINQFEREILENKMLNINNAMRKVIDDILSDVSKTFIIVEDLREHLLNILYSNISEEEKIKQLNETREKIRYKYMKRKDILKMLKENDFSEVKSGRHRNFENKDGKKIPMQFHSKDLGKGLSIKIQKEIFE
ncbi:type II toxin-antitoxin system HicA family toxin [Clostridium sp.]|uniref:type II toxin-antitoxin system HicA family toxin n=1 Tax=Clostridium sp. TaxID=1506 RepID=UPI00261412DD|nr:type II toxin-antitoxin system HicA family toxin [Clostridium sp.]